MRRAGKLPTPNFQLPKETGRVASAWRRKRLGMALAVTTLASVVLVAQGTVAPTDLLKPSAGSWPMYNGDYSGRRFSALKAVNTATVKNLSLAWSIKMTPGPNPPPGRGENSRTSSSGGRPSNASSMSASAARHGCRIAASPPASAIGLSVATRSND